MDAFHYLLELAHGAGRRGSHLVIGPRSILWESASQCLAAGIVRGHRGAGMIVVLDTTQTGLVMLAALTVNDVADRDAVVVAYPLQAASESSALRSVKPTIMR